MNKGNLERIDKVDFKLERDIQNLTEENMDLIFGMDFVKSEFQLNNLRIDSLAFDEITKSFVIIEYKKDINFSVIDQGYAYLALLLNNKSDFILEYNEVKENILGKKDVDWSQSRVIFVAPQFTTYQRQAIEFKDLPIELWQVSKYENNTILFNQLKASNTSESITTVSGRSKVVHDVNKQVKVPTEEEHLKKAEPNIKEIYNELRERILHLDSNIEIKPYVVSISFKIDKDIVHFGFQKTQLKIWLNLLKGNLNDPQQIARDVSTVGHHGFGDYELSLKPGDDLDYVMTLIKQAYKMNS